MKKYYKLLYKVMACHLEYDQVISWPTAGAYSERTSDAAVIGQGQMTTPSGTDDITKDFSIFFGLTSLSFLFLLALIIAGGVLCRPCVTCRRCRHNRNTDDEEADDMPCRCIWGDSQQSAHQSQGLPPSYEEVVCQPISTIEEQYTEFLFEDHLPQPGILASQTHPFMGLPSYNEAVQWAASRDKQVQSPPPAYYTLTKQISITSTVSDI